MPESLASLPKQSAVLSFKSIYGDPRNKTNASLVNQKWYADNLVPIRPAYQLYYSGIPVKTVRIHRACAPHFSHLFLSLWIAAKEKQATVDQWGVSIFGGSFNYRLMRGLNTLSMHSFGCAIDLDPVRNGLNDATPRFAEFPEVMKAFRDSGLTWGGDWDGNGSSADERRCDGMHLQATVGF